MRAGDFLKPIGVFVTVILVVLAGTAVVGTLAAPGGSSSDGADVDGQSPKHYQPDNVEAAADAEDGELSVDGDGESKRILVDTKHSNQFSKEDLEPLIEALVRNGHEVDVESGSSSNGGNFGQSGIANATLQQYDALLSVAPTKAYTEREVKALRSFAEGDGRILLLGEPTQFSGGSILESGSSVRASGDRLAAAFGLRVGSDTLYNMDDRRNDNNYESIYADPADDDLTDGVDTLQLDRAGYLVRAGDSDAEIVARAVEGTKTLDRDRAEQYPVAARNGNFVLVADASFIERSELYDVDNEQFVSNLLTFLVSGDKEEGVPPTVGPGSSGSS